mmetsp:Transcript_14233/g.40632  ORF Transcript_14233/g.40632 Transcript_14233/m.40632 type:complete len:272 (-) Transcript_14233:1515-2330(-)
MRLTLLVAAGRERVSHSWEHSHHRAHRSHSHHRRELIVHYPQVELPLHDFFHRLHLLLLRRYHVFDLVHEARNIPPAHQRPHKLFRIKLLELMHMLSSSNKRDRRFGRHHCRKRAPSFGMSVKLRDDDGADIDRVVEGLGLLICRLPNGTIHDEYHSVRFHRGGHLTHLLEQALLLPVPTRGINNDQIPPFFPESFHTIGSDDCRVRFLERTIVRYLHLGGVLLQLIQGSRAERVCANECWLEAFFLVIMRVLGCRCRLEKCDSAGAPLEA